MVDKYDREKHVIAFYRRIEDIVNNTPKTYSLIAIKKKYDRGDVICDINTGEIYNVLIRDSANNNLLVLKPCHIKLTKEEKDKVQAMYIMTQVYLAKEENKRIEAENRAAFNKIKFNYGDQYYNGYKLNLINRSDYYEKKAKRYTINNTNQNIWIPNKFLHEDGTIKSYANLDFIFNSVEFKNKIRKIS